MDYKIINNQLKLWYWIDTIKSLLFFRKIKFSELKNNLDRESKNQEDIENIRKIHEASVNNPISINSILFSDKPIEEDNTKNLLDKLQKQITVIWKDNEPEEISKNLTEFIEQSKENEKIHESTTDISNYSKKVKCFFSGWKVLPNIGTVIDVLFKYKNATDLTRFDIWNIAWNINTLFSSYFQWLFYDLKDWEIKFLKFENDFDEKSVVEKVQKWQSLEIYEMFRFVCWVLENDKKNLISQLKDQSSKDAFNILKWYLDYEAYGGNIKWHFYVLTLDQLRRFRNYQAHHNDEKNIEKIIKTSSPDKMKWKFFNKFLWDLEFDWAWLLQFIMNKDTWI